MAEAQGSRQFHNASTSDYVLPNDNIEHGRLELQSQALEMLMHNNIFHSPVKSPNRILDIGCGTGRTTVQLAAKFPEAQVVGIDLSPVPSVHAKPDNVEYVQGDIRELIKWKDPRITGEPFDYVFSRLLSMGMTIWPGYFADVASILAPGGWFEVHEYEVDHHNADGSVIPMPSRGPLHDLMRRKGLEPLIAVKAGQMLRDSNFIDIREKPYIVPFLEDDSRPETAMIQKVAFKLATALKPMWSRLGEGVYSQEELDRLAQDLIDDYDKLEPGSYVNFMVVCGQKEG